MCAGVYGMGNACFRASLFNRGNPVFCWRNESQRAKSVVLIVKVGQLRHLWLLLNTTNPILLLWLLKRSIRFLLFEFEPLCLSVILSIRLSFNRQNQAELLNLLWSWRQFAKCWQKASWGRNPQPSCSYYRPWFWVGKTCTWRGLGKLFLGEPTVGGRYSRFQYLVWFLLH